MRTAVALPIFAFFALAVRVVPSAADPHRLLPHPVRLAPTGV